MIALGGKSQTIVSHPATGSQPLEHLYRSHHGWLRAWLSRRLSNAGDAEDLAHDTFVRVLKGHHTPERGGLNDLREPRAYLTTVAKRLLVNHYERQSLERAYMASLQSMPEPLAISEEHRALLLETLRELDALLDALPAKARTAFLLCQLEGLSYAEIAAQLRVSERTVTRYMAQGFRQCLQLMLDTEQSIVA